MGRKAWWISAAILVLAAVLWMTGMAPMQIAKGAGKNYVNKHFPEMKLECVGVEYASAFGDYLIAFRDKDGNTYSCVIGPPLFPVSLGQGLFYLESYYAAHYTGTEAAALPGEEPLSFRGTVREVTGKYLLVEPDADSDERRSSDRIKVPLAEKTSWPIPAVGDTVHVFYSGEIQETYPACIPTVYRVEIETGN